MMRVVKRRKSDHVIGVPCYVVQLRASLPNNNFLSKSPQRNAIPVKASSLRHITLLSYRETPQWYLPNADLHCQAFHNCQETSSSFPRYFAIGSSATARDLL